LILLPVTTELALRSSWLGFAWQADRLAQRAEGEDARDDWRSPSPFWRDRCTTSADATETRILYAGGSSLGGAYQFNEEPEVFFPARLHARLCEALAPKQALLSISVAQGNRNSFTISRSIGTLLASTRPDLVVLYLGVNERTANHPWTRKEMEALSQDAPEALRGLAGLAASSRFVTGAALLLRSRRQSQETGALVAEVPLADFVDNLEAIVAASADQGAEVLLVPEYTSAVRRAEMLPYEEAQADLAQAHENVSLFHLRPALGEGQDSEWLLDHNHMSRAGHQRVEALLFPHLATLLPGATASDPD
jgi:lysophospholipase L1-like esterase